jgi:hypothetical protein
MKKVLIISYFYPPANFVGAQRTAAWAKYLHEYGYYPIIITRQWNEGQTDLVDKVINNKFEIEKNNTHEVHRLPYKYSLRDRLANYPAVKVFQKALTLKELVLSNYSIKQLPFSNFYAYSKNLIQKDSEINIVIASGRPFQAFFIGHQLKKDFPRIHWIPDYRDEWTSHQTPQSLSYTHRLMSKTEQKKEKEWTSNISFFISVSKNWTVNIARTIEQKGVTVLNGFSNDVPKYISKISDKKILNIGYLGSAYATQNFKVLLSAVKELVNTTNYNISLNFYGSKPKDILIFESNLDSENRERIKINFFERTDRNNLIQKVKSIDLLYLTELENNKGWLPVKLFDYFNSNKPILLCPSDNDLMENFIKETNSGYIANTVAECTAILEQSIQLKKEGKPLIGPRNEENAHVYSRKYQTEVLATYLDALP